MKPKARYTFSGVQSLNLSDYGLSVSLTDGDSIDFDVRSDAFRPLLVDAIESYIRWNAKDADKQKLAKRLVKEMEVLRIMTMIYTTVPNATARNGMLT